VTFQRDGRTYAGEPPDEVANIASALGAEVAGVNCSLGPQSALEVIDQMAANTAIRLSAMPNAGLPKFMDGRLVYPATPDYYAEYRKLGRRRECWRLLRHHAGTHVGDAPDAGGRVEHAGRDPAERHGPP
jgi:methionine synthase I (cobalamin-dependent)